MINLLNVNLSIDGFAHWLFQWLIIGLAIILIVMIFYGFAWYFFKMWSSKENEDTREKIHSLARWMIMSSIGLLTIEIILCVIFLSIY